MKIPLYIIYALLTAFFAALVPIFGKLGLRDVDSTVASVIRAFIMFAFLLLVALATRKTNTAGALLLVTLSGVAGALSWLFYFMAIKNGRTTAVIAIDKISVALAIALAWIVLGEKVDFKTALGAVLIIVGALLVSL